MVAPSGIAVANWNTLGCLCDQTVRIRAESRRQFCINPLAVIPCTRNIDRPNARFRSFYKATNRPPAR